MTEECEPLFAVDLPIRKGSSGYLEQVSGDYDGHPMWALAPVDPIVRREHGLDQDACDFVWLVVDGRPVWALVLLADRTVVELDPQPATRSVRELLHGRAGVA